MKYKIFIKDLNNNIKEEYWDLTNDQKDRFIDSDNIGYATSFFTSGNPTYVLVTKKIWENKEEFLKRGQEIMLNTDLSQEQKDKHISDLFLSLS